MARVIVRAVAVPGTPLLVPGVAGAAEVLAQSRAQVLDVLRELVRDAQRVVVLDCAARSGGRRGPMRPGLDAAGVEPRWCGWRGRGAAADLAVAGLPASVALLALGQVGWDGPVEVVELAASTTAQTAVNLLGEIRSTPGTGLVVVTGVHPSGADGAPVEQAVLAALAQDLDGLVQRASGEYEERCYEVVRFAARASTPLGASPG